MTCWSWTWTGGAWSPAAKGWTACWSSAREADREPADRDPVAGRGARLGSDPPGGKLAAPDVRLRRARLPGERRLHGPGQLGDGPGRRRAVRLPARVGPADEQPDGGAAPDPVRAARRGHGQGPGAGLPRLLPARARGPAMAAVRGGDRGVRPGRGAGRRDRPQAAVRPAAARGRADHGAGRAAAARAGSARDATDGGPDPDAGAHDRILLRGGDAARPPRPGRRAEGAAAA